MPSVGLGGQGLGRLLNLEQQIHQIHSRALLGGEPTPDLQQAGSREIQALTQGGDHATQDLIHHLVVLSDLAQPLLGVDHLLGDPVLLPAHLSNLLIHQSQVVLQLLDSSLAPTNLGLQQVDLILALAGLTAILVLLLVTPITHATLAGRLCLQGTNEPLDHALDVGHGVDAGGLAGRLGGSSLRRSQGDTHLRPVGHLQKLRVRVRHLSRLGLGEFLHEAVSVEVEVLLNEGRRQHGRQLLLGLGILLQELGVIVGGNLGSVTELITLVLSGGEQGLREPLRALGVAQLALQLRNALLLLRQHLIVPRNASLKGALPAVRSLLGVR
mmetsp:Transcript_52874/g.116049  ORF Transcript_52874/g.116049 Transcript_52874/m.116049 type:complete len:327 (+) Transcript_52874:385-1365(+)